MKKLTILLLCFLFNQGFAQKKNFACGDAEINSLQRANVRDYDEQIKQLKLKVKAYIADNFSQNIQSRPQTTVYTIPVVFHVVHSAGEAYGTGSNISYLQLQSQIDALNAAFGMNYPAYNGQTHPAYAQNTNIRFCLARTASPANVSFYNGPLGIEYGVMRYADNTLTNNSMTNASATALTGLTHPTANHFPFANYLNIWVVSNISGGNGIIMGYAPLPLMNSFPLDGIVMRSDVVGDNTAGGSYALGYNLTQGKILVHEMGHYLNLRHIFEGGCTGANAINSATDACDLNGDCICDIEPSTTQNISCTQPIPNTCTANYPTGTTTMDMIESYMSYADDDCMNTFTMDQAQRMWATLNTQRYNLWQQTNLGLTGVVGPNGCNPALLFTNLSVSGNCINAPIAVTNPTAGNSATSWTWTAAGATPPSSNASSLSITYPAPGLYWVKLAISDGTLTILDSLPVSVNNCSLDPKKLYRSNWMHGDYCSVNFSTGQPVPNNIAVTNNTIKCFENAVSMSDSLGNLLFYSNGRDLWNSNHVLVNPGAPLFGWDLIIPSPNGYNGTSVGGFISFPAPKKPNKYFIVCVPPYEINGHPTMGQYARISYVIYDVVTQTVSAFQSFINPVINYVNAYPNFGLTENLTAVPHCNGVDYWIVARGTNAAGTGFLYYSFLVNENGASPTAAPVMSGPYPMTLVAQISDMRTNSIGNKLVAKGEDKNVGYIWDFNQATGEVTNPVALASSATSTQGLSSSGIIFSPNDQYIYSSISGNGIDIDMIDVASNTVIKTISPANGYYLPSAYFEMGPDDIIYMSAMSNAFGPAMGQISNPNSVANSTLTTYVDYTGVPGSDPDMSMLNYVEGVKPAESSPFVIPVAISCSNYSFSLSPCWQSYSANWNFGDNSPIATGTGVTHTYGNSGAYTVSLTLSYNNQLLPTTYTQTVNVFSAANVSITGPTVMCSGSPYLNSYGVTQFPNATYLWSASNATIAGPSTLANITAGGGTSGIATLSVTVNSGGCNAMATKTINLVNLQVSLGNTPTVACINQTITVNGTPAGGTYVGTTSGNIFSASSTGTYNVAYTYVDANGCYKTATRTINVLNCATGIEELDEQQWNAYLYPNPNNGILYVKSSLNILSYEIVNTLGQLIQKSELVSNGIGTGTLSNGVYFISLKNASGEKIKLKFVKE